MGNQHLRVNEQLAMDWGCLASWLQLLPLDPFPWCLVSEATEGGRRITPYSCSSQAVLEGGSVFMAKAWLSQQLEGPDLCTAPRKAEMRALVGDMHPDP